MAPANPRELSERELHEYVAGVEGHESQITGLVGYFYQMYRAEVLARGPVALIHDQKTGHIMHHARQLGGGIDDREIHGARSKALAASRIRVRIISRKVD